MQSLNLWKKIVKQHLMVPSWRNGKTLDCGIVVSKFELQAWSHVQFRVYTGWNDKIVALEKTTWFHFYLMKTGFFFFFFFLLQTIY